MHLGHLLAYWIVMFAAAVLNGILADRYFVPVLGDFHGQVYKVIVLGAVITILSAVYAGERRGPRWLRMALGAGLFWAVLTCATGGAMAHFMLGFAWKAIPTAYLEWAATPTGKFWSLVPLCQFLLPTVIGRAMNMR